MVGRVERIFGLFVCYVVCEGGIFSVVFWEVCF